MYEPDLRDARYEVKIVTNEFHYHYVRNLLTIGNIPFASAFQPRRVNNLYFDTPNLDAYLENLSGISSRTKLRLRWYGDVNHISDCCFEIKSKRNRLGWKNTKGIKIGGKTEFLTFDFLLKKLKENLDSTFYSYFQNSQFPVLINSYQREYFFTLDKQVRVTLDRGIRFYDQRSYRSPNLKYAASSPNVVVMEVKANAECLDEVRNVLLGFPISPSRSSKYVFGVQSILGC